MKPKTAAILTSDQSKAARRELNLSQNQVIAGSGVLAYKLKQFEGRGLRVESAFLQTLRDFYEAQGVDFDQLDANASAGQQPTQAVPARNGIPSASRPGFLIAEEIPQDQVDRVLDRMDENDSRVLELVGTAYEGGMLGGVSDATEAAMRELFGLLAESHLLFRFLHGQSIVEAAPSEPKTIGDMLSQWVKDSPAYGVFGLTEATNKPEVSEV